MESKLMEAVETLEDVKGSVEYYEKDKPEYSQAITKAQKFIESYLALNCKQATLATQDKWYGAGYVDGQNALLKKMDGIRDIIFNVILKDSDKQSRIWFDDTSDNIAQSIKDHLTK